MLALTKLRSWYGVNIGRKKTFRLRLALSFDRQIIWSETP